jgi:hypothetical protein
MKLLISRAAAAFMLVHLDRGDPMSRHRIGLASRSG